jgi:hypothetical protein
MSPGIGGPKKIESTSAEDGGENEMFELSPEGCSLSDSTEHLSIKKSITHAEELLEKCLRRAESKIDSDLNEKEAKEVKINEIEDALQTIKEKHKNANPKKVEGKLTCHLLHVFGEKHEELTGIEPINKLLAEGRSPKSPTNQFRQSGNKPKSNRVA